MYYDPTGHFGVFGMEFGNPVDGFRELFLTTEEEREQTFETIRQYGGNDGYTNFVSNMGAGLAEVGDAFKDPVAQWEENNQTVIKPFITETLGIKEDSKVYKGIKYVGTKSEAVSVYSVNMVKGIGALGAKGVETGIYNDLNRIYAVGNMFGLVDDNTYAQVNYKVQENNQFWASLPSNMINGIGNDIRTTINGEKARNFFLNPDASLQNNVEYFSASTNTVMTGIAAAKMASTLGKVGTAGYTAYKTAMQNSSVLAADTGMGVTLNASTKAQVIANAMKQGVKAGYSVIKRPSTSTRIVGDSGQSKVYRVIRPDENPSVGLVAKKPNRGMTTTGHVVSGSRNKGSQFISTTTDINVANKWANKSGNRIVEIDLGKLPDNAKVYDLSTDIGRTTYIKGSTANRLAKASSEVLVEGTIPSEAIQVIR